MHKDYPKIELKTTEDGSSTLYRPDLDEPYHSIHGAIQESMHVFINAALKQHPNTSLKILEIGFGTGLNALLTLIHGNSKNIFYHTIERYPLTKDILSQINYPECLGIPIAKDFFKNIHNIPWNKASQISSNFTLYKEEGDFQNFTSKEKFDLIYFDAFAPDKQPELWSSEIFLNIAKHMKPGAILTTYSAKGSVKRALLNAGLKIEKLPGPPGKKEMLRARNSFFPT
jgi:tRNA U34 5-methylaminomethyl-2-thiouridine-forming methyltransferase MnmC